MIDSCQFIHHGLTDSIMYGSNGVWQSQHSPIELLVNWMWFITFNFRSRDPKHFSYLFMCSSVFFLMFGVCIISVCHQRFAVFVSRGTRAL